MELRFEPSGKKDKSWVVYDDRIEIGLDVIMLKDLEKVKMAGRSLGLYPIKGRVIIVRTDPSEKEQLIAATEYIEDFLAGKVVLGNNGMYDQRSTYDEENGFKYSDSSSFSFASGKNLHYVVIQVTLKEKFIGTGSANLTELEEVINKQAAKGYRLHTITTSTSHSTGMGGGDRIQATMVFEKLV